MLPTPPHNTDPHSQTTAYSSHQHMTPYPTMTHPLQPMGAIAPAPRSKRPQLRIVAAVLVVVLTVVLYFVWRSPTTTPPTPTITQSNVSTSSFTANPTSTTITNFSSAGSGNIQVYVVGAVKHPGVYTLPDGARVYQLLQAAGGPLPNANLVALNMAAKLSDGQEIYVAVIGETPPVLGGVPLAPGTGSAGTGQPININTATVDQMRLALHISSKTAQKIIDYRLQHGPYTSVDQLLQVVSRAIYDKIKGLVTV